MSDIKISQMEPWVGAVTGNVEFPAVFANENYRIALSQLTPSTFGFGNMALQNSNAVSITGGNVAVTALSGAITIANGGTGLGATPTNGQLLIGTGSGYALATLTAGSGISITNSSGGVTIAASGAGFGTVTSVNVSGAATGLIFSGGPVTTSGVITMSGTLAVANGGTGGATATLARANLSAAKSGANSDITSITGLTTPLSVLQGGTGANESLSGYIFGNGMNPFTSVATIPMSDLTGTLPINKGGTNATTVIGARASILHSYVGNANKILAVNAGASDVQWTSVGAGTVISVGVSGGTTGLTTTGGPVTFDGTITLGGVLNVVNGGTGATSATNARVNLSAAKSGANSDITSIALTTGTVSTTPASGSDLVNKTYVDTQVSSGITYHTPVKYEVPNTTGNLTAIYNQPGGAGVGVGATLTNNGAKAAFAPDGPTASIGDRILIYNQTNAFENGIYEVVTVGTADPGGTNWVLRRTTDADTYALKDPNGLGAGDAFFITAGNTGAGETYVMNTVGVITFGTTAITFAQVSDSTLYTAGNGLQLTGGTVFSLIAPVAIANGGTNGTATPTAGTVAYGTGTAYAFTSAGTTGQVLLSNGSSAPSWGGIDGGTF